MKAQCPKCGSEKLIPAHVADQGKYSDGQLHTFVYSNPDAWVFKGAVKAQIYASICGDCGFTELYAEDPATLYDAFRKHLIEEKE